MLARKRRDSGIAERRGLCGKDLPVEFNFLLLKGLLDVEHLSPLLQQTSRGRDMLHYERVLPNPEKERRESETEKSVLSSHRRRLARLFRRPPPSPSFSCHRGVCVCDAATRTRVEESLEFRPATGGRGVATVATLVHTYFFLMVRIMVESGASMVAYFGSNTRTRTPLRFRL